MSNNTKNMLLVIGEHILFIILSVFLASTFSSLLKHHMYVLSIITGFLYVTSTYSAGWQASKKDYSMAKEELRVCEDKDKKLNYRRYQGFLTALPNFILSLVLLITCFTNGEIWYVLFRLYNSAFVFALADAQNILIPWLCVVAAVLPYLAYGVGYIMGKNKKVLFIKFLPSILYKKVNKE